MTTAKGEDGPPATAAHPHFGAMGRILTAIEFLASTVKALAHGFPPGHPRTLEPATWAQSALGEFMAGARPGEAVGRGSTKGKAVRRRKSRTKARKAAPGGSKGRTTAAMEKEDHE